MSEDSFEDSVELAEVRPVSPWPSRFRKLVKVVGWNMVAGAAFAVGLTTMTAYMRPVLVDTPAIVERQTEPISGHASQTAVAQDNMSPCEEDYWAGVDFEIDRVEAFFASGLARCRARTAQLEGEAQVQQEGTCAILEDTVNRVTYYHSGRRDRRLQDRAEFRMYEFLEGEDECFLRGAAEELDSSSLDLYMFSDSACEEVGPDAHTYAWHSDACMGFHSWSEYMQFLIEERAAFEYPHHSRHGQEWSYYGCIHEHAYEHDNAIPMEPEEDFAEYCTGTHPDPRLLGITVNED